MHDYRTDALRIFAARAVLPPMAYGLPCGAMDAFGHNPSAVSPHFRFLIVDEAGKCSAKFAGLFHRPLRVLPEIARGGSFLTRPSLYGCHRHRSQGRAGGGKLANPHNA